MAAPKDESGARSRPLERAGPDVGVTSPEPDTRGNLPPASHAGFVLEHEDHRTNHVYYLSVLRVIAAVEFKMKYTGSVLGYVWSLAKPLAYFGVLWFVFSRVFKVDIPDFALYLMVGIVMYSFFTDATSGALASIVSRGALLRRISFPPLIIPLSLTVTAAVTFAINWVAVFLFALGNAKWPRVEWLALVPLLAELYLFIVGVGLILATVFVRLRDVIQLWELVTQLMLFATPVMYPIELLPLWAQRVVFLNPLVQVMQDARALLVGGDVTTAASVLPAVPPVCCRSTASRALRAVVRRAPAAGAASAGRRCRRFAAAWRPGSASSPDRSSVRTARRRGRTGSRAG